MKKYLEIYFFSILGSLLCIIFPWALAYVGVLSEFDVLECYAILFGLIALVVSAIYVIRHVKEMKARVLIILLNPAIYYIIAVVVICIMMANTSWNGFNLEP